MRSLLISFAVIIFCFAINIVNEVDRQYIEDKGISLFGFTAGTAPISTSDLNDYSDDEINKTLEDQINPVEQTQGTGITEWINDAVKKMGIIRTITNTLFYSTIGFYQFLANLGRPESGITLIPMYIGVPLTILVNINHFFAVAQFIRGFTLE